MNPTIIPVNGWIHFFKWSKEQEKVLEHQWQVFSLLYDSMDNHALHLIQPIWPEFFNLIPKINETPENYLDFSWLRILITRAFRHANFSVQRLAVMSVLDIDFKVYRPLTDLVFVCEELVLESKEPRLFMKRGRIGERLVRFYHNYFTAISEDCVYVNY